MTNDIQSIPLVKLVAHPDNPNRMSKANFTKLVRNIERTGRYEPLIVRPAPENGDCYQIINGHHRCAALRKLGFETAEAVVWDVDDEQTDILLATLNRLSGSDVLGKKLALLRRLSEKMQTKELAKLLPQTAGQIERLNNLKLPSAASNAVAPMARPLVFFVSDKQQRIIEQALDKAGKKTGCNTKAARKTQALVAIAQAYLA